MFRINRLAAVALALSAFAPFSAGAIIVQNAGANNLFAGQFGFTLLGAGFLSPGVPTTITNVVLPMDENNANPDPGAVSLSLFSNNSGVPGSLVASLGSVNVLAADPVTNYVFTPAAPVNIAASTQYWLVVACACPNSAVNNWGATTTIVFGGLAGAAVTPSAFFSHDGGSTWTNTNDRTFIFQVNGDVTPGGNVPEPSTFALMLGAAAILYFKRRR
jgi:hypothetical protein